MKCGVKEVYARVFGIDRRQGRQQEVSGASGGVVVWGWGVTTKK